jgi:hypothetical protein
VRAAFAIQLFLSAMGATSAFAENWPEVGTGETLTIEDRKKLPAELNFKVLQICGPEATGGKASAEFFALPPNHQFVIVRCSHGFGWIASLFENKEKDRLNQVSLPVGDPSAGFEAVTSFSTIDLNMKKQRLQVSFVTDACGVNGEDIFTYQFERGTYRLTMVKNVDCDSKPVKTVWKAHDFNE